MTQHAFSKSSVAVMETVRVGVRVRPLLPAEQREAPELCISTDDARGLLAVRKDVNEARTALLSPARQRAAALRGEDGVETLSFDHVWGAGSTQEAVFAQVEPLVDSALEGYNSTVFAYGPSGSGKTHTMVILCRSPPSACLRMHHARTVYACAYTHASAGARTERERERERERRACMR